MDIQPLGKLLGSGKEAEIFEYGALVVKLYRTTASKRPSFREAAIMALVETLGLPVPEVRSVQPFGERWGITSVERVPPRYSDGCRSSPRLV